MATTETGTMTSDQTNRPTPTPAQLDAVDRFWETVGGAAWESWQQITRETRTP